MNSARYEHFLKCLRLWEAMMPKKAGDEISGELMARGYWRVLGEKLTEKEMSDLTELVLDRCKWFPTVAECREIMAESSYSNPFYVARRQEQLARNGYTPALPPSETQKQIPAQGMAAASAGETRSGSTEGNSPVPPQEGCAQNTGAMIDHITEGRG